MTYVSHNRRCGSRRNLPGRLGLTTFITAVALMILISSSGAAQEFTFRFNPPDGISFVETSKLTRITDTGTLGKRTDVSETETRVTIRRTPTGYTVTHGPISAVMTRDGKKIENPVAALLLETEFSYELDSEGYIQDIRGFDVMIEKMKRVFPPAVFNALAPILNEEALVNKEVAEWNGQIGGLIGRTARLGEAWTSSDDYALPSGEVIRFYTVNRFAEWVKHGARDYVRMVFYYDSDPEGLRGFLDETVGEMMEAAGVTGEKPQFSGVKLVGEGERLIDPATMLMHSETVSRTITFESDTPGLGRTTTVVFETREITFDYTR